MKTRTVLIFLVFVSSITNAQNYLISFAAADLSTKVDSILVRNLKQSTSLLLSGTDTLLLSGSVGLNDIYTIEKNTLRVYPNPMLEKCAMEFDATSNGKVIIELFDIIGKRIVHNEMDLLIGHHTIDIMGLSSGIYNILVSSDNYRYTGKILSNYSGIKNPILNYIGSNPHTVERMHKKSSNSVQMQYNDGERLLIKSYSGNNTSLSTIVPTYNSLIVFNFYPCTDGDGNNYETVVIGTQVWMAENLKATKYATGSIIPLITDWADWGNLTTSGYCWYNNEEIYKDSIGALYNWFAVDQDALCPGGWHVPSDSEWNTLSDYLGGLFFAGGKLKEVGINRWLLINTGATNESGFTALPGSIRHWSGAYQDQKASQINWWGSDDGGSSTYASVVTLSSDSESIFMGSATSKNMGLYVRCIKN